MCLAIPAHRPSNKTLVRWFTSETICQNLRELGTLALSTEIGNLTYLKFQDYKFQLTGCTTTDAIFSESLHDVPNNLDKIWTLVKTSEELIILCNEVQVMRMVYRERVDKHYSECYSKWSQVVSHISLIKGVTAYRSAGKFFVGPFCEALNQTNQEKYLYVKQTCD